MTHLTRADIADLEAKLAAATPGKWTLRHWNNREHVTHYQTSPPDLSKSNHIASAMTPENAALIVALRNTIDALLAERKEREEALRTMAARDVLAERKRQVEAEGWTPEHDDKHVAGEMAMAAACYAEHAARWGAVLTYAEAPHPINWPWHRKWWKPRDRRRDLVRAGALILAEIERLDRAALTEKETGR